MNTLKMTGKNMNLPVKFNPEALNTPSTPEIS